MRIPDELKKLKQWGCFHKVWDEGRGKYNKYPIDAYTGNAGKSNDTSTWSDYDTAVRALENFKNADGLAFYFANGYVGLDIDHIDDDLETYRMGNRNEDNIVHMVKELTHNTYMEISVSGNGIHAIFKGKIPGKRRRSGQFEMYETGRFFALTGNEISSNEIKSLDNDEMKTLYEYIFGEDKIVPIRPENDERVQVDLSVQEIVQRALNSAQGDRFKKFLYGGWEELFPSQSEADMSFANMLAFWCGRDFHKMDTIFRNSALIRDKYDEKHGATTYGIALLRKAINESSDVYTPKTETPKFEFKFNQDKPIPPRSWDDMGLAQRFIDQYGDKFRYSYVDKKWYFYNGSYWTMDDRGYVSTALDAVINSLKKEKPHIDSSLDEKEAEQAMKQWQKFVKHCRSAKAKSDVEKELRHHLPVMHSDFDKESMLLNTPSGYVDLTNGVLHDHDIEKMFTQETGSEYSENIDCPRWKDFLYQIFKGDEQLIHYIQKVIGYSATASVKEQAMFILFGNGRNGKSVFLDTIQKVLGTYTKTMNVSSLMVKYGSGPNSDIARLEGARMVISSEANEGSRMDEGLVKQLTGGDTVVARHMYGSEFEFKPTFKIFMATNHRPLIRGTDEGIWRRLKMIPFDYQVPKDKVDKNLTAKLESESMGILNWIVEGAIMWQSEGLEEPDAVIKSSTQYRDDMDIISMFVTENCDVGDEYEVKAIDLFEEYMDWSRRTNEYSGMSNTRFGREISKRFTKVRRPDGNYYSGLKLKSAYDFSGINN